MEQFLGARGWRLPLALAVLIVLFFRPVIVPPAAGEVLDSHDLVSMFYPIHGYIQQTLQDGELPLWNPHEYIGVPLVGNSQANLFYPGLWLVWLWGNVQRGMGLLMVFHTWLGAWGMARFMKGFGASHTGRLLAGVIYAMSGWLGARYLAGHFTLVLVFGWLPWAMVAYRHALHHTTWAALLPGVGVLGASLLAGHPPLEMYLGLSLVSLWGWHVAQSDDPRRAAWDGGWRLAVIVLGGMILAAGVVLPAAELARLSVRESGDLAFANKHALPPAQYISALALPGLFGRPMDEPYHYWGADFFEEFTAYAGLLPLLALPLTFRWARRDSWYFVGLIAFGLVYSLGIEGALMPLLVRWIPGFGLFRVPARALLLTVIGLAGLTALLITELQTRPLDERREALQPALRLWLPVGITLAFGLAIFFAGWYASASHVEPMPLRAMLVADTLAKAGVIACGVWVVLWLWTQPDPQAATWALRLTALVIVLDAWHVALPLITVGPAFEAPIWTGARSNIPADGEARVVELLPPGGPINGAYLTGHLHVLGYDPLPLDTFDKLQALADPYNPTTRVNTLLGVRYALATEPYDHPDFDLIGVAYDSYYYERRDPFPRAWFAGETVVEPDDARVREHLMDTNIDLRQTVYVDQAMECPTNSEGSAAITEYRPNDVTIETEGGGLLVLSDQYYPGWRATINGDSTAIVRADTLFRAVCVPPGGHTIRFEYRPRTFYVGAGLSAAAWATWLILTATVWRKRIIWRRQPDLRP